MHCYLVSAPQLTARVVYLSRIANPKSVGSFPLIFRQESPASSLRMTSH